VTGTSAAASHDLKRRGLKLPPQALPWLPRPQHKMREGIAGLPDDRRVVDDYRDKDLATRTCR
jgi:hypothetical protein